MKKIALSSVSLAAFAMLAACGDEVTEVSEIHQDGVAILEAGEVIGTCDAENAGEMLFVTDSAEVYFCDGKAWQSTKGADGESGENGADGMSGKDGANGKDGADGKNGIDGKDGAAGKDGVDGKDGSSCTASASEDGSIVVSCDGNVVGTLVNGKDGVDGKDGAAGKDGVDGKNGKDGADGASCTATVNQEGNFDLVCGGKNVGTIKNGKDGVDGKNGKDGADGAGCTFEDDGNGTVTITCGEGDDATETVVYKGVCGMTPFDPEVSFCSDGKLYSCDGKPYDPEAHYCLELTRDGSKIYSLEMLFTDDRDNHVYKTVKIGDQMWMAENLNYLANSGEGNYCYGNEPDSCAKYGRLYTWAAAVGEREECATQYCYVEDAEVRGVCPEGWHIPSRDELKTLVQTVGGEEVAGKMLKSTSGWSEYGEGSNGNGTDSYGFSALPAGVSSSNNASEFSGLMTIFWSTSINGNPDEDYGFVSALGMFLKNDGESALLDYRNKAGAYSVRCLQNK